MASVNLDSSRDADLLEQLAYLGISGSPIRLLNPSRPQQSATPTFSNLGVSQTSTSQTTGTLMAVLLGLHHSKTSNTSGTLSLSVGGGNR